MAKKRPTFVTTLIESARQNKKETYFTGKPCKRGHLTDRYVSNGECILCKGTYRWKPNTLEKQKQHLLNKVKAQAKFKGIPFNITLEDLKWPTHCPILGIELDYFSKNGRKMTVPSFDRRNPKMGYEKGNVFVISNRANSYKSDATIEILEKLLEYTKGEYGKKEPLCG